MPVAAVTWAGRPTVSAGSEMTIEGSIFGWKMIFFTWVASLVMTEARPTSEPVPEVVGTAMVGHDALGIGAGPIVADILEIPHRPLLARHEGDGLAASSALPPPKAMIPS